MPTKDGNNLVCVLPEQITSPSMTAEWENTLMQIERGNADADKFLSGIVGMTSELVKAYPFLSEAEANRFDTGRESIGKCPRCGSPVYVGKGNYYCSNKECSFCMWEDNKFFTSKKKKLTKKIAAELLDKGWCRVTGLYTPKRPQLYDAVIRLNDTGGKYGQVCQLQDGVRPMTRPRYIASCSGGKDSVATILLAAEKNEPLDEVIYSEVMLNSDANSRFCEVTKLTMMCSITLSQEDLMKG